MTPLSSQKISEAIFEVKGDFTKLEPKTRELFELSGQTVTKLSFCEESFTNLREMEWTASTVSQLIKYFPNLEQLELRGAKIVEFGEFFQALQGFKKLNNLQMGEISLKDRHIEALTKSTKINAVTCSFSVAGLEKVTTGVFPKVHVYDARLHDILDPDVKCEKLADGFEWVEGPIWNKKEGFLLFSDIPRNSIYKWQEVGQKCEGATLFLHPSGYLGKTQFKGKEPGSNGLTYNAQGELHLCQHGERRIVKLGPDNEQIVVADRFDGKRLNSPNDLVFKSTGELYFTDPPYGLFLRYDDPEKELPFSGIYRVKDGVVELLCKDLLVPNGLAFSPDEKYLYVSNTGNKALKDSPRWWRFEVKSDGTLGEKEIFYESSLFSERRPGSPDGLKVDDKGNLFCAGPGGIYIFSKDKELLGFVEFAEPTANCNFGGDDGKTLFITSNHAIFRLPLKTKGAAA